MVTPWRRDAVPSSVCACGHALEFHNIETKSQPCGSCECVRFALAELRWRETRYVTEEVL